MSEWRECKLGDAPLEILDGDRGKNYPSQNELKANGYCLFLNTKNVRINGFDFSDCQYISKERDGLLRKGKLKKDDIVLTTRGTIGNIAFFDNSVKFENIRINSGMVIIRPNEDELLPLFNYYIFRKMQDNFHTFISGSAQPQLPIRDLKEIDILIPPLSEQKAIAAVLSGLDDKIDLLHRQNKTLEALAETLFKQWFVVEAKEDWEKKPLGDFTEISSGKGLNKEQLTENGIYPVLGANGEIGRTNAYLFDEKLLFTGRVGTLGNIFIVDNKKVWLSDNTLAFRKIQYFYFTYFVLKFARLSDYNVGSTQPLIRQSDIREITIYFPCKEKLDFFESQSEFFFLKIKANQAQIQTLETLRDTLLPKLMSGEVRVNML